MIWATVRCWFCFWWLYRTSPSSAAKNTISLISVLTIWWCPCVEPSLVLLEEGICYNQSILLLASVLLHFVLQGQTCLLFHVSLDFLLLHSSPLWWKGHLFLVLVLESLVSLHRTVHLQHLQHYWSRHRYGLLWYWVVCLGNRDHSLVFEISSKYCISDFLVDCDGYSISSNGFLPTVVDTTVIWVKFTHSSSF